MQNLTRQWITLKYEFLQNNGGQHLHKTNLMQKDPGPSGITNDSKYKAPLYIQTICSIYFCRGDIYVQSFGGFSILSIILESWYLFTAIRPGPPRPPPQKNLTKTKHFLSTTLALHTPISSPYHLYSRGTKRLIQVIYSKEIQQIILS